jgi:hypothetical protein
MANTGIQEEMTIDPRAKFKKKVGEDFLIRNDR